MDSRQIKREFMKQAKIGNGRTYSIFSTKQGKRFYQAGHRPFDCLEPLMLAYKTRCGLCRQSVVARMEKNGVLSEEIRAEFQHDAEYLYGKRTEGEK